MAEDESSKELEDFTSFTILQGGQPLVMQLMVRRLKEDNISFSCVQLCSSVNGLIQWNPVVFKDQDDYNGKLVIYGDYEERDDERLTAFLQQCNEKQCIGCVLVNPDEGMVVTSIDFSQYSFPVYLLNRYNGTRLKELVKKHEVFIKTDTEELIQSFSLIKKMKNLMIKKKHVPVEMTTYITGTWKPDIDFNTAPAVFTQCFLFFQRLDEEALKQNLIYDMNDINRHIFSPGLMSSTFPVMFPVYIYYTAHIALNLEVYLGDDQPTYVEQVIAKFHELVRSHSEDILHSLHKFRSERLTDQLKQRWKALATSFLNLLEHWLFLHREIPHEIFVIAIPTIMIAQVIMKECGAGKSELQKLWGKYLLKHADRFSFRQQGSSSISHIHLLKEGIQFQVANRLPPECYFTPKNFKELLSPPGKLVSLLEARNALLTLPESLQYEWRTCFVSDFVMPLRIVYRDVLRRREYSHFTEICSQGDWTGMITEGIGLVNQMESFIEENGCKESFADKSFKWLRMFVKCVQFDKIMHSNDLRCIDSLLDENKAVINHRERIRQKLCSQLRVKLKFLSPEQFLIIESYMKRKGISDDSLFEDFFRATEIQRHANQGDVICSKTSYFRVIQEWVLRNSTKMMTALIDLLHSVYQYYVTDERPSEFFLDLIQLNVCGLFPVEMEYSQHVKSEEKLFLDFLQKKMSGPVAKEILNCLSCYMKLPLRSTENRFQYLVCKVVLEGLKSVELVKEQETYYEKILVYCRCHFTDDKIDPKSPQTRFVCGIIHVFTSKVNLKSPSWISTGPVSILSLLKTILPLYNLCDEKIPKTCNEMACCFEFFNDVRKKVESIGNTLNDQSITFNQLNNFRDNNSLQKITRITEIFKLQKESIGIEKLDCLFKKFDEVRSSITKILIPSFLAKNVFLYDSLFNILKRYRIQIPKDLYDELVEIVDLSHIDTFLSEYHSTEIEIQLRFCGVKNIVETEDLLRKLRGFLGTLCDKLHIFCFFNNFECFFFESFIVTQISAQCDDLTNPARSVGRLSSACDEAVAVIKRAVSGDVTLKELGLNLSEKTGKEIATFHFFTRLLDVCFDCQGDSGFKALMSLRDIRKVMLVIEEVCSLYELEKCMQDATFQNLSSYSEQLRIPENIALKSAVCIEKEFKEGLPNVNGKFDAYLELFCELKRCFPYVKFLRSKGFIGEEGKRKFSQERNLITQEIQHTLEQRILDYLWDAYSILCYFLDTTITYHAWKNGFQSLSDVQSCVMQLRVLHQHSISQLENIFALKESESKESTRKLLKTLINNGIAVYIAKKDSPVTLLVQIMDQSKRITEEWDLRSLSEFATAVELMQINRDNQDNQEDTAHIKLFLQIYEDCLAIIDILRKLKDAGHFDYLELKVNTHKFNGHSSQWKSMLDQLKKTFQKWEVETPKLRKKYTLLSFFSNWKVYQIYKMIKLSDHNTQDLERLIGTSMLFAHSPQNNIQLKPVCQIADSDLEALEADKNDPFSVVGEIISCIWKKSQLRNLSLSQSCTSLRNESNFLRLYFLNDCSNLKLYTTALNLLQSPLTPFQVLPCTGITTQEAITLFFQRVKFMSQFRYILIDVNVLQLNLQEVVIKECSKLLEYGNSAHIQYDIYFIESKPSLMRTMPWCFQDNISLENGTTLTKQYGPSNLISCDVVYGHAGNGKSYYIRSTMERLHCSALVLSINEGFNAQKCIKELNAVSVANTASEANTACALHLNFTLPFLRTYAITEEENRDFQMMCKLVNWFFFSLLLAGYVEDYHSGESFSVVQLEKIHIFVEVPVLVCSNNENTYIDVFFENFLIFSFIATSKRCITSETMQFNTTTADAMLVCKYFDARNFHRLDVLYKVPTGFKRFFHQPDEDGVRIGNYPDLDKDRSFSILQEIFKKYSIKDRKIYQKMFVRYMYRRCKFMEDSFQLRFFQGQIPSKNNDGENIKLDGKQLRSSLLYLMEGEASEMCLTELGHGFNPPHIQLVFDECSFGILTRGGPAHISSEKMDIISRHGFEVPGPRELKQQSVLEDYLCRALNIRRIPGGDIPVLRDRGYVLTLDYLLKMISIHERQQCGMPVIISGETGVGKTFLLETLSSLYNYSQQQELDRWRNTLFEFLKQIDIHAELEEGVHSAISSRNNKKLKNIHDWFKKMQADNDILHLFPMIEFSSVKREIPIAFNHKTCHDLLLTFLFGKKRQLFKVLKIHTGLTPINIKEFLRPIIEEEHSLQVTHKERPKITVFFDEVNTSSCLGFLKEIIVDHCVDGEPLPENIFFVAACNPYRRNSISTIVKAIGYSTKERWFKGDYLVRPLHPSFELLIWNFGFLEQNQEIEYIESKLKLLEATLTNPECKILIDNIAKSQGLLRQFTQEYLLESKVSATEALAASSGAVSQRDIQRVLKIYIWLKESFKCLEKYGYTDENAAQSNWQISVRALYLSLALVYYFRLNEKYRDRYAKCLDSEPSSVVETCEGKRGIRITFTKALVDELNWLMENIELPPGVADTKALRENLFTIIICTMTKIPLIIVGPPGSSKTLSFKIVVANLLGEVSRKPVFRKHVMKYIEPYIYQCSKHSVSDDIQSLFEKATLRQKQIDKSGKNAIVVVFMDEAGLPEEKLQVLKVLHYLLDDPQVSFVALSNTILDAAKSNRAICLFQVHSSHADLQHLAETMLRFPSKESIPVAIKGQITCLIDVYLEKMPQEDFNSVFGLRDILHFFSYIRKKLPMDGSFIPPEIILRSLQRNFSGGLNFRSLAEDFLMKCGLQLSQIPHQDVISTLKDSLADKPVDLSFENEVRHKLLIDHSDDESIVQLLFKFHVLQRKATRIHCLSRLHGDRLQKATTVAKIKNSIVEGHTVILIQCDEIFESFYDLFNQRYTSIDDERKQKREYYACIASGSKSSNCLVHHNFQCVVLVKLSEVQNIPAPFMNRFEKYPISHDSFLTEVSNTNNLMFVLLNKAKQKAHLFLCEVPPPGIYGLEDQTLNSLMIAHLSVKQEGSNILVECINISPGGDPVMTALEKYLFSKFEDVQPTEISNEISEDIDYVLSTLMKDELVLSKELVAKMNQVLPEASKPNQIDDEDILKFMCFITQLLCVRMLKELLQLMPPEVFLAMKEKIPKFYVRAYLNHQYHFSLEEMVKDLIDRRENETSAINKILCFSRTTSFVFENLPHEFFDFDSDPAKFEKQKKLKIVFPQLSDDDIACLCVLQVLHNSVGGDIHRKIKNFLLMENYEVMLLLVNMQDASKETVNYLRLTIEETEFEINERKNFILLLHFPSESFFVHCYPSYFLDGWNLCYLDAVAPTSLKDVIDLKSCFLYAYSNESNYGIKFMEEVVDSLLSIEVAAFSTARSGTMLPKKLLALLSSEGANKEQSIGSALKIKFCKHWSPTKMMQTLQQAANSALSLDYTLNMTDAINTIIKSNFFNFMHYMLTLLTKHGALSILSNEGSSVFLNLICNQIESIDLPTSSTEMKIQSSIGNEAIDIPMHFPFFHSVYHSIEDILKTNGSKHSPSVSQEIIEGLKLNIKNQSLVSATVEQMDNNSKLWTCYMLQFLSLFHNGVNKHSELLKYFCDKTDRFQSIYGKVVWLHCSFNLIPHNILSLLKFLDGLSAHSDDSEPSSEKCILELLANPKQCAEELIRRFYNVLIIFAKDSSGQEFEAKNNQLLSKYRDVFLCSPLKEFLYVDLTPEIEVIRDGIAVFFTLISTNSTFGQAFELLKHFTKHSLQFADILIYRIEYLMKMPVETLIDAPFITLFSTRYIDPCKKTNIRNFVHQILEVVIHYSSDEQREQLIDWICVQICTHDVLNTIPFQRCEEPESVSSLCFVEEMFCSAVGCDQQYLKRKVQEVSSLAKNPIVYPPYFLRCLSSEDLDHQSTFDLEPLKSLLFLRELKRIMKKKAGIGSLVSQYNKYRENNDLWTCVKKEAIVSLIVEETAKNIVNRSDTLINEVDNILTEGYYGLFLVFKMFNNCKSFRELRKLLLHDNELCKNFSCLTKIRQEYFQEKMPVFPEMTPSSLVDSIQNMEMRQTAKQNFNKVSSAIKEMVNSAKQEIPRRLIEIMTNSCIESQHNLQQSTKSLFTISLFLSLYQHVYLEEIQSTEIAELLKSKVNAYIKPMYTHIMSIFICGGKRISSKAQGNNPLYSSFSNPRAQTDDFKDMWKSAANLIACVLGTCESSSNLWMHLFCPNSLDGTYVPGSTTEGQVGKQKKLYSDAMMLSDSGLCKTHQSFVYLTRGKASLPCIYFIQWANYTCLCVYLLGLNTLESESPFTDKLFQESTSAHSTCMESMERLWNFFLQNLGITAEQRIILITGCIWRLFEAIQSSESLKESHFMTQKELDKYEKYINDNIFIPAWNDMLKQTVEYQQQVGKGSIHEKIIQLQERHPVFADERSFLILMMTSTNFCDQSGLFYVLYQFLLKRPILDIGIRILPEMVDFYQWIHKQFPYCLTRKETESVTVSQLLENEQKHLGADQYRSRIEQFTRLCAFTCTFQERFGLPSDLPTLTNEFKIKEIISTSESSGLILKWIDFLINENNNFLIDICQSVYGFENYFLQKLVNDYHEVSALEVEPFMQEPVLGYSDIADMMPLVERSCCLSSACFTSTFEDDKSLLKKVVPQIYHLKQLQDDVVSTVIVRLRRIKPVKSIAMRFTYKNVQESVTAIFIDSAAVSLDDLENVVPLGYRVKPDTDYLTSALRHCHSLSYFSLVDITIGLRIAAEYIIQVQSKKIHSEVKKDVMTTRLPDFLKKHVLHEEGINAPKVLKEALGIDVTRLNQLQYMFLHDMLMRDIMKALHTFVMWLEDGLYDFSSFPFVLKGDLESVHEQILTKMKDEAISKGQEHQLLETIRLITHSLASCEKAVREIVEPAAANKPLKGLLSRSVKLKGDFESFPDVHICQYVRYRLALRRMYNVMLKRIQERTPGSYGLDSTWDDSIHMDKLLAELGIEVMHNKPGIISPVSDIKLCDLTCEQVVEFIRSNNIGEEYALCADDSEVDGDSILTMKDKQLRKLLGMSKEPVLFLQFKFMIRRKYGSRNISTLASKFTPQKAADFCAQFDSLKSAIPFIKKYGIDGEMLLEADIDVLKQIFTDSQTAKDLIEKFLHD